MYFITWTRSDGSHGDLVEGNRRKAFAFRNRLVKQKQAVWAVVIDAITGEQFGFGTPAEARLMRAIFNQPIEDKKPKAYYRNHEQRNWDEAVG